MHPLKIGDALTRRPATSAACRGVGATARRRQQVGRRVPSVRAAASLDRAHLLRRHGDADGPGAERSTIAFSQRSSSTSRTIARAEVLSPVGRNGVAKNTVCSASSAASARAIGRVVSRAWSAAPAAPRMYATSARSRAARARQASIAAAAQRVASGGGPEQRRSPAATRRRPGPSRRAGRESRTTGPGSETGSTNDSSSERGGRRRAPS